MIIISPYKTHCLLPAIQRSKAVSLHQHAPRQSFAFNLLDKLTLHNILEDTGAIEISDMLRMELNLLQDSSFLSYIRGISNSVLFLVWHQLQRTKAYMLGRWLHRMRRSRVFVAIQLSPVNFLRDLMSQIRRDGQNIDESHIGKILTRALLCLSDFEGPR